MRVTVIGAGYVGLTVGACLAAVAPGAHFLRVHDVRRVKDALTVFSAVFTAVRTTQR
jgi:UDP-glucose 6-dehydrogenase